MILARCVSENGQLQTSVSIDDRNLGSGNHSATWVIDSPEHFASWVCDHAHAENNANGKASRMHGLNGVRLESARTLRIITATTSLYSTNVYSTKRVLTWFEVRSRLRQARLYR